jgi:hypothetical protein
MGNGDRTPPSAEHHDEEAGRKEYQQDLVRERQEREERERSRELEDRQERQTRIWAMWIHFSVLAGWAVPLAGVIVPIVLWQLKKDELPGIEPHAHVVINWILSSLLYLFICFLLMIVVIGVIGIWALALATVVFSIVGGIRASEGTVWPYPGTIIRLFR